MLDLSEEPLEENIATCKRYLERMSKRGMTLEIELGVTGGEEDGVDNAGVDASRLYTQPEEVAYAYEELSKVSDRFTVAASFGNVHGVYEPGNVKLTPKILDNSQRYIQEKHGTGELPVDPDGADEPNKKYYDPRNWLRKGEDAFRARLKKVFEDLNDVDRIGCRAARRDIASGLPGRVQGRSHASRECRFRSACASCYPESMTTRWGAAVLTVTLAACGNDAAVEPDAGVLRDLGQVDATVSLPDAGPSDMGSEADGGLFLPGAPAAGDPELRIHASRDEAAPTTVSEVRQGDILMWQCGPQAEGIGHIWGSFRLETEALDRLTEAERDLIDAKLEIIDEFGVIVADNEGLFGTFVFSGNALTLRENGVRMVINRGEGQMPANARPSTEDEKIVRYRVTVELPTGRRFVREAWVDTLVPPTQQSDDPDEGC
jgi:hypothetical protein